MMYRFKATWNKNTIIILGARFPITRATISFSSSFRTLRALCWVTGAGWWLVRLFERGQPVTITLAALKHEPGWLLRITLVMLYRLRVGECNLSILNTETIKGQSKLYKVLWTLCLKQKFLSQPLGLGARFSSLPLGSQTRPMTVLRMKASKIPRLGGLERADSSWVGWICNQLCYLSVVILGWAIGFIVEVYEIEFTIRNRTHHSLFRRGMHYRILKNETSRWPDIATTLNTKSETNHDQKLRDTADSSDHFIRWSQAPGHRSRKACCPRSFSCG